MRQRFFAQALLAVLFVGCASLQGSAQAQRPLTWLEDLTYLRNASAADPAQQRDAIAEVRAQIANWLKLHPSSGIKLPPAPEAGMDADRLRSQIIALQETVEAILKEDPDRPFHLGVVEVNVTAAASTLSPVSDSIDQTEILKFNSPTVAKALDYLPGVSIQHVYGNRNQSAVSVHGFNYKQVPLYVDGIPMNVPYDGYMDFNRFLTSDVAEIQVAKGSSSALMGPNTLGGAINVVTKEPQKKLDGDAFLGTGSGDMLQSWLRLGSRWRHFFVQGSVDWLQSDYVPLSGNFITNLAQPDRHLNNSYQQDAKYSGRVAWMPRGQDQYVFSYSNQKSDEGIPLFTGNDPYNPCAAAKQPNTLTCWTKSAYRRWGYWDKTSYYFNSNTGLGESSAVKLRFFYDQYPNVMNFYTDASFATLNPSFITAYDDHAHGFSTELTTRLLRNNVMSASFLFKDDTHKEIPYIANTPPKPATLSDRAQTTSIGLQDAMSLSSRITATIGFSADHLNGLRGTDTNSFGPLTCNGITGATYGYCTPHLWTYNPQVSVAYGFKNGDKLFAAFAEKSRFPVIKEQYSAFMGSGVPSPNLETEHSRNWSLGYSHSFATRTVAQLELFRSDLRDAIESIYVSSSLCKVPGKGAFGCTQNVNVGKEVHQGVEFTLRSTPMPRLTLDANYTYLSKAISFSQCDGSFSNQIQNCVATDVPKHKLVGTATLSLPRKILAMASARYQSGTTAVENNAPVPIALPMSNFGTMDLGTIAPIYKGVTMQAGVKNLFDRNYYYVIGYPESGRNWYFGMRYKF